MRKVLIVFVVCCLCWLIGSNTEADIGVCLNKYGDGKLYNNEPHYNYICYPDKIVTGDLVVTLCFLKPYGENDEIIYRTDFKIGHDATMKDNTEMTRR